MALTIYTVLLLIAALLLILSAFNVRSRVDLFKLGWGLPYLRSYFQ